MKTREVDEFWFSHIHITKKSDGTVKLDQT